MIFRSGRLVVAPFVVLAACAHSASTERSESVSALAGVAELRRCIDVAECRDFSVRLRTMLNQRLGTATADRLVDQIVETMQHGDATPVLGDAIAHCRRGHQASCRALWWAMDRLFLDEQATPLRADECPLTHALATAMEM